MCHQICQSQRHLSLHRLFRSSFLRWLRLCDGGRSCISHNCSIHNSSVIHSIHNSSVIHSIHNSSVIHSIHNSCVTHSSITHNTLLFIHLGFDLLQQGIILLKQLLITFSSIPVRPAAMHAPPQSPSTRNANHHVNRKEQRSYRWWIACCHGCASDRTACNQT